MPSCGALISKPTGKSELFGFDFNTNIGGEVTSAIKFETDPIEISIPLSGIKIKLPRVNLGINNPIQKWYPLLYTWKQKKIKKKIHTPLGNIPITIPIYIPTQALNEIYFTYADLPDIPLFTIPSFKFNLDISLASTFTLQSHFSIVLRGLEGLALSMVTQQIIEDAGKLEPGTFNKMTDTEQVIFLTKLFDELLLANIILQLKGQLLYEGVTLAYIINSLGGNMYINIKKLKIEFGEIPLLEIPEFILAINVPDMLKDASGVSHPITVSVGTNGVLKVKIFLFTIKGDFYQDIINGIEYTLSKAENATRYDFTSLRKTLDFLKDTNNAAANWAKNHLGLRSEYNFYFMFCPTGMTPDPENPHPPTPFFLVIETVIYFNPYKILETTLDFEEILNKAYTDFEEMITHKLKFIPKEFKHTFDKAMSTVFRTGYKYIRKVIRDNKKRLDHKLINAERKVSAESNIPIVPP